MCSQHLLLLTRELEQALAVVIAFVLGRTPGAVCKPPEVIVPEVELPPVT